MPGLVGTTGDNIRRQSVEGMLRLITHKEFYIRDEIFDDRYLSGGRSHIGITNGPSQPYNIANIFVWIDGEIVSFPGDKGCPCDSEQRSIEKLGRLYEKDKNFSFINDIEGTYAIVIYDANTKKIHFISDRYGLRHLYIRIIGDTISWSSEIKAFLALPDYTPQIDLVAVEQFLGVGYLLEDRTWFKNVSLLPPGTVLTWDVEKATASQRQYWWWNKIKADVSKCSEDDRADRLYHLFDNSVKSRCKGDSIIGLLLSGGLDSRAILAAIPNEDRHLHAVTFGQKNCSDVKIARRAAKVGAVKHLSRELNPEFWLKNRFEGVWWTDGELNLMHMHGIEVIKEIRDIFEINMSGFAGDLILGGSYMSERQMLDKEISLSYAMKIMECSSEPLWDIIPKYSGLNKTDYFFLQNRVRRCTFCGIKMASVYIGSRMPFYGYELIDYIYSLPDVVRYRSMIYKKMLLRHYSKYFDAIPWQKTGIPINWPESVEKGIAVYRKMMNYINWYAYRAGIRLPTSRNYASYAEWIRKDPAITIFRDILFSKTAIYPDYVDRDTVYRNWERHMKRSAELSSLLCLYVTFEIWLQQIFNAKYRDGYC